MHGPASLYDLLRLGQFGDIQQAKQFAEELPRVFLMAVPGLLLSTVLTGNGDVERHRVRAIARLTACLVIMVWARFVATQWYLGGYLRSRLFPTPLRTGFEESRLHEMIVSNVLSTGCALGSSIAVGIMVLLTRTAFKRGAWGDVELKPTVSQLSLVNIWLLYVVAIAGVAQRLEPDGLLAFELYDLLAILPLILLLVIGARSIATSFDRASNGAMTGIAFIVVIVALFPTEAGISTEAATIESYRAIQPYVGNMFWPIAQFASALLILPIAATLRARAGDADQEWSLGVRLGSIVFAYVLTIGQFGSWAGLITVLTGLLVAWPFLALSPSDEIACRRQHQDIVQARYGDWVAKLSVAQDLRESLRSSKLKDRMSAGEVTPTHWSRHVGPAPFAPLSSERLLFCSSPSID